MAVITVDRYGFPEGGTTFQRGQINVAAVPDGTKFFDTDLQQLLVWSATNSQWQTVSGAVAGSTKAGAYTVAAAGSVIGNAAAITPGFTWVTGANGTKGVQLPVGVPGMSCDVSNDPNANAILKVYPQVNSQINVLGNNAAISMAANAACSFRCEASGNWYTFPDIPS